MAELLADADTLQSRAGGGDLGAAGALAEWLEERLGRAQPDQSGPAATDSDAASVFAPFAAPADLERFLAEGASFLQSPAGNIRGRSTYRDAVAATFGESALRAATAAVRNSSQASSVAVELLATCGLCCIPTATVALELDDRDAYRFLSGVALSLQMLRTRLETGGLSAARALRTAQSRLIGQAAVEVAQIASQLVPDRGDGQRRADFTAADVIAGALIELRADCVELSKDLESARPSPHRFTSAANRAGVGSPIVIDHRDRIKKLEALMVTVQDWITSALMLAAREPEDVDALDKRFDQIALALAEARILLGVIQISEAVMDRTNKPGLAEDLLPYAINLESFLVPIESYVDVDRAATYLDDASWEISTLINSEKWSGIVHQAMSTATDIILAIETGGSMGGLAGGLRAEAAAVRASTRVLSSALTEEELTRIATGRLFVTKVTGKAAAQARSRLSRLRGKRGERGLGLGPGRPRDPIPALTSAIQRIPDKLPLGSKSFWEVKNVHKLRLTWQLSDFMLYAQATRRRLTLFIRPSIKGSTLPGTVMTRELRDAIKILKKEGLIQVKYLKKY
ncbi:MAG: putative toxin [Burkholderiales bacterium]